MRARGIYNREKERAQEGSSDGPKPGERATAADHREFDNFASEVNNGAADAA